VYLHLYTGFVTSHLPEEVDYLLEHYEFVVSCSAICSLLVKCSPELLSSERADERDATVMMEEDGGGGSQKEQYDFSSVLFSCSLFCSCLLLDLLGKTAA